VIPINGNPPVLLLIIVEPTNYHFYCFACSRHGDVDPDFDELRDRKTGQFLTREEVVLEVEGGPYERRASSA